MNIHIYKIIMYNYYNNSINILEICINVKNYFKIETTKRNSFGVSFSIHGLFTVSLPSMGMLLRHKLFSNVTLYTIPRSLYIFLKI